MLLKDPITSCLGRSVWPIAFAGFWLGIAFHQCTRRLEIDYRIWRLLSLYAVSLVSLTAAWARTLSLGESIGRATLASFAFNIGLFLSIGIYRLFFHRLRHFPGPIGAKLSRLYATLLASRNIQYYKEVENLHRQYGDFVRTGPREISILRASALPTIHGVQSPCRKSTWYSQVSDEVTKCSLNSSRDYEDHKRRRRAWDQGFSVKALKTYEPQINAKINLFISQMTKHAGHSINITQWSMFFTFDTMGLVGFGKDFNMLDEGSEHSAIKALHYQMTVLGVLSSLPWLMSMLGAIPGLAGSYALFTKWCGDQGEEKQKTFDPAKYPSDIYSWLLKAKHEKDRSAPPGEGAFVEDGRLIIIAGSDTTASTLASAIYFLCQSPEKAERLRNELKKVFPNGEADWSIEKLKEVPYLEGVIDETLRLKPAIPSGVPRVTPEAGLQIDDVFIPGDTNVIVPTHAIQRDSRYFVDPNSFVPERWMEEKAEMVIDRSAYAPFSQGVYGCIGKNLALMQLRGIISRIVMAFDLRFAPGETGETFDTKAMDTFTLTLPALYIIMDKKMAR